MINIYTMPNVGASIQLLSGMLQSHSIELSHVCIQKRVVHIVPMINIYTMPDAGESIQSLSGALQSCSFGLSRVCIQKRVIHIVPTINIYNAWRRCNHLEQKYTNKLLSYLWYFICFLDQLVAIVHFTIDGKQIQRQESHPLLAPGHGVLLCGLRIEQLAAQPIGSFLHEVL